ncbi:hypothetical protein K438DRAFT_1766270 [Mycena galopus ATCC 62051]|nr:hypothetical protein K438DRAFT_1766270 [Mycena galopus ATCC 62051]
MPAQVTLPAIFPTQNAIPTAVVLGVDSQGHTTYGFEETHLVVLKDEVLTTVSVPFPAISWLANKWTLPVTVVAGSDYAALTYSLEIPSGSLTVVEGVACGLKNGGAVCTNAGLTDTFTITSMPSGIVLDVVSTAAPSQPTNKPNSSSRLAASFYSGCLSFVLITYSFL